MSELLLKSWLLGSLKGGWCDVISPGSGSTFGFPDLGMLVPGTGLYLLVELKLAEPKHVVEKFYRRSDPDGGVTCGVTSTTVEMRPARLRPTQIAWHDSFARAGGYSRIAFGIPNEHGWTVWAIDRPRLDQLKGWKAGLPEEGLTKVAEAGQLDIEAWWKGPLEWWQGAETKPGLRVVS